MGFKNQGAKKRGEAAWSLLFLNTNGPVFCTLLFATHILSLFFFQGHKPTNVFTTTIVGVNRLGNW
jgi:hypothetical protein